MKCPNCDQAFKSEKKLMEHWLARHANKGGKMVVTTAHIGPANQSPTEAIVNQEFAMQIATCFCGEVLFVGVGDTTWNAGDHELHFEENGGFVKHLHDYMNGVKDGV